MRGLLIGVGGMIFSVLVPLPICGVRFVNSIYSLLVYLIVVVSIFGLLALSKMDEIQSEVKRRNGKSSSMDDTPQG